MFKFVIMAAFGALLVGCTGSRTLYSNGGITIKQVGADPTPINGGFNLLVIERDGMEPEIQFVSPTPTIAQQLAMPGATLAGAAIVDGDSDGDTITLSNDSSSSSSSSSLTDLAGANVGNSSTTNNIITTNNNDNSSHVNGSGNRVDQSNSQ